MLSMLSTLPILLTLFIQFIRSSMLARNCSLPRMRGGLEWGLDIMESCRLTLERNNSFPSRAGEGWGGGG